MIAPNFTIKPARTADDFGHAAQLFRAYAAGLGIDLAYQNFDKELVTLPGRYAPPGGDILLAWNAHRQAVGCVALRSLGDDIAEMKRMYVTPEARGTGLGRALATAIVDVAMARGYREIRLDTLATLTKAVALYESMGFVEIDAYYDTPVPGTRFFARMLGR